MNVSVRQMETFQLFSQTRSMTETARILRISQPAISQMLKEMESQLGFSLFVRVGSRTRLTDEAMQLLPHIEQVLRQINAMRGHAAELRDVRAGSLSISSVPTFCTDIIPRAMLRFREERPLMRFRLDARSSPDVPNDIKQERADLGFAITSTEVPGVIAEPLLCASVVCIVPRGHPLTAEKVITLKHLKDETLIIPDRQTFSGLSLRDRIEGNTESMRVIDTNRAIAAISMVRHGLGVALVHTLALTMPEAKDLAAIPFLPDIPLTMMLLHSRAKPVSRTMMRFMVKVKEVLTEVRDELAARNIPSKLMF